MSPTPDLKGRRIGIVGVGTVGGTVRDYARAFGADVRVYDKYERQGSPAELDGTEIVFVCVPTPHGPGEGLDISAVREALDLLSGSKTVVIKSTCPPGTTEALQARYPQHRLFFNPEFLREKTPLDDFLHPDRQLVGYTCGRIAEAEALLELLPAAPYARVMPATACEAVKLLTNAFLAVKVIFANEAYDMLSALGVDFEDVKAGLAADPRIGGSHLDVLDGGYRGFGGKCLPKDVAGIVDFACDFGTPLTLLEVVQAVNNRLTSGDTADARRAIDALV
jgi:UDPglucose 6-dehydrogenase